MDNHDKALTSFDTTMSQNINGRWLPILRFVWAILLGLSVLIFVVTSIASAQLVSEGGQVYGDMAGVGETAVSLSNFYFFILSIVGAIPFFVVSILLFLRKSDNWWMMIVSLMLATFGGIVVNSNTYVLLNRFFIWTGVIFLLSLVGNLTFIYFLYTLPNGRFANRPVAIMAIATMIWFTLQIMGAFGVIPFDIPPVIVPLLSIVGYGGSIWAQNIHKAQINEAQQQQVKWISFGLIIALIGYAVRFLPEAAFPALGEGSAGLLFLIIGQLVLVVSLSLLPITIGFSMVRYRLWEVDFFINRSLVYGIIVVTILMVMGVTLLLVQSILVTLTGRNQVTVALLVAAVVAGATFQPLHHRLQRWIDSHLYGIHVAYHKPRPTPPTATLSVSEQKTIGVYEVQGLIGRGGMANVYLGEHPTLHQTVAIKVMLADQAKEVDFRTRFEREAQAIASLRHSNIVKLYDFGEAEGTYYMVMEYIDGPNLRDYLQKNMPLPLSAALPLLTGIAAALDYAHEQGFVHRDIKPSNVMVQNNTLHTGQQTQQAILTDFGIVKMVGGSSALTRTGLVGTLDYIAPEQIKDAKDVDGRADLYSFGVIVYEMLTGQRPFTASNPGALLIAHLQQPAADPRTLQPDIPSPVAKAVLRLLAKEPVDRYNTAGDFIRDLHG